MDVEKAISTVSSDVLTLTYQVNRLIGFDHATSRQRALSVAQRHLEVLRPDADLIPTLNALGETLDQMAQIIPFPR